MERELLIQLVLPLLDETSGDYDKTPPDPPPRERFFDEQARHDGLTCAWIVGEQEPFGVPGEHVVVDGLHLMRQRFDVGSRHGQQRVKRGRMPQAQGFDR